MHTRFDIVLCNVEEECSMKLTDDIFIEIQRIELLANRFDPQSELSRVNQLAAFSPFKISAELFGILLSCLQYNELTFGAFDISIQSFNDFRQGINNIVLNSVEKTVFFKNSNVQIDLSGYIKGYALDKIKNIVLETNCNNALINIGNSSILALGNHPNGKGWKVSLPKSENEYITLNNQCLTNSGNSSNHLHIKNPQTGEHGQSTTIISVITDNASDGEILSTSLCVCTPELIGSICERLNGRIVSINQ